MNPKGSMLLCTATVWLQWLLGGSAANGFCPISIHQRYRGGSNKNSTTSSTTAARASKSKQNQPTGEFPLSSPKRIWNDLQQGYAVRVAADPSFPIKSLLEVFLAAATQFSAEYQRRGWTNVWVRDVDFVVAGILTAVYGKYASMWKVAKTTQSGTTTAIHDTQQQQQDPRWGNLIVPTNAFQPFLLDGTTRPTIRQRLGSFLVPIVPLFRAGVCAGWVGYGMTSLLMALRSIWIPQYRAATQTVNIVYASLYTGCFMAVVSNVRYQLLQGIVEPLVDSGLRRVSWLRAVTILVLRFGNGWLGSTLAISGMRWLGLQKLK